MGTAQSMIECADIVKKATKKDDVVVTVSAVSGVTNALMAVIELAKKRKPRLVQKAIQALEDKHFNILKTLIPDHLSCQKIWNKEFQGVFERLHAIAYGTTLVGDMTDQSRARIAATGEKLSSRLFALALQDAGVNAQYVFAERMIHTDDNYLEGAVNERRTRSSCRRVLMPLIKEKIVPVITGFTGVSPSGEITLLGRGASDYTSVIIGTALDAKAVEIWTDVNGIMSADPRVVPDAISLLLVNVDIASEMTLGGAKVVHAKSVSAAVAAKIPVYIFNTFNRAFSGTKIVAKATPGVIGFSCDKSQLLMHFKSPAMKGQVGFLEKITSIYEAHNVSVDLCATSEITVTMSIDVKDFKDRLLRDLEKVASVDMIKDIAKITIVAPDVTKDQGFLEQVFKICKQADVALHTVSIGASYRNISLVVDLDKADTLVQQLHKKLGISPDNKKAAA